MKFIVISDTHGLHQRLKLPKGDTIIHAGDFSGTRPERDAMDFLAWFSKLSYKHKIFIGGNHDFFAARRPKLFESIIPKGVIYLNDSGTRKGAKMQKHWDLIPQEVDILITHTPPFGILDKSRSGNSLGCEELRKKYRDISPSIHVFGHVHASYGRENIEGTTFINASNYNSNLGLVNKPVVFHVDIN